VRWRIDALRDTPRNGMRRGKEMFLSFDTRRVLCKQQRNHCVKPTRAKRNRVLSAGRNLSRTNMLEINKKRVATLVDACCKTDTATNLITKERGRTQEGHANIVTATLCHIGETKSIVQTNANTSEQSRLFWKGRTLTTEPTGLPYAYKSENTESARSVRSGNTNSASDYCHTLASCSH
jgi:hypothetical protein